MRRPVVAALLWALAFALAPCQSTEQETPSPRIVEVPRLPSRRKLAALASDREPLLLRVEDIDSWEPMKKWTPSYVHNSFLAGRLPEGQVTRNDHGRFLYDRLEDGGMRWKLSHPSTGEAAAGRDHTVASVLQPTDGKRYYLSTEITADRAPRLLKDLGRAGKGGKVHLWVGSANVTATPHYDYEDNVYVQLSGEKRFYLYHPGMQAQFRVHPVLHPSWRQAQVVDPFRPMLTPWTAAALAKAGNLPDLPVDSSIPPTYVVTLRPGDVLFLPPFWFHMVVALTPSMSVNFWWDSPEGTARKSMKSLSSSLGGLPFGKSLSPPQVAASAVKYLKSLLSGIFEDEDPAAFVEEMLETRYALYRHAVTTAEGAEQANILVDGSMEVKSMRHLPWREAWHKSLLDAARVGTLREYHNPNWDRVALEAFGTSGTLPSSLPGDTDARIEHVVGGLVPAYLAFPPGIRRIVAGDHLDAVATSVVSRCLARASRTGFLPSDVVSPEGGVQPHDIAAWISQAVLPFLQDHTE